MKYETKKIEIALKKVKGQVISNMRFLGPRLVLQCSVESRRDRGSMGRRNTHTGVEPGLRKAKLQRSREGLGFLVGGITIRQ